MEGTLSQYPPGDPKMIDTIVHQLKSQGIFDQFRKECIADVDTKPAYQNLHQRVEGTVSGFLANQRWRPDMNKNLLRDSLRKHIHDSGFLDIGVERIVDQVVNPKVLTVFVPKVEDVVYSHLGVDKPKKKYETQYSKPPSFSFSTEHTEVKKEISLTDLLPKDLDPVSPESDVTKKADNSTEEGELNDDKDEEESPPFKPLRGIIENSNGSSLSGISGLTSPDSRHSPLSFNGVIKDRPLTPRLSPVEFLEKKLAKSANTSIIHEAMHTLQQPLQDSEKNKENKVTHLTTEEVKKPPAMVEPLGFDDDRDSSSSSSRPSSSASDSSSSSCSSSSDTSESPEAEPLEERSIVLAEVETAFKNTQIFGRGVIIEEMAVKKDKQDVINKDDKVKKLAVPISKEKRDDKHEKVEMKHHEKDEKSVKKSEQDEQNKKVEKELKANKKIDKEKKIVKKDDRSTKKHGKEHSTSKYWEKEDKLFSIFDQGETTLKRVTKDGKIVKVEKEEKSIKREEKEDKSIRLVEKDNTVFKEEKLVIGKSLCKDVKDSKLLKVTKVQSLHKNEEVKLSSKEDVKKIIKKDVKDDKLAKKKYDDRSEKTPKKDDKSVKSIEKDTKIKKEGKHESTHQDSKSTDSKNHPFKTSDGSHHSHKSHKTTEKERVKLPEKHVLKDLKEEKLKVEDKIKHEKEERSKVEEKSKHDKYKSSERSRSGDKSRHDEKYKLKNGNVDKDKLKLDSATKSSNVKEKSHKHEVDKQEVKPDSKSKSSTKHKDSKKDKVKLTDDHSRHRDKRSDDRGSTDRDSNGTRDRSSSSSRTPSSTSKDSGHRDKKSSGSSGKSGKGGNNDSSDKPQDTCTDTVLSSEDTDMPLSKKPKLEGDPAKPAKGEYVCINNEGKLLLKIKKPKIAANIYEVRKIMQQRRSLAKLEKRLQKSHDLSSSAPSSLSSTLGTELSSVPQVSEPLDIQGAVHPMEVPDNAPLAKTPAAAQPAKVPELKEVPQVIQTLKDSETNTVNDPNLVLSTKVCDISKSSPLHSLQENVHSAELPQFEASRTFEVTSPSNNINQTTAMNNVTRKELSPAKMLQRIENEFSMKPSIKDPENSIPDIDDDEPDLTYFESPEINEYDKYFLSFMKGLTESENLSDIDVSSVNTDDLEDLTDTEFECSSSLHESHKSVKKCESTFVYVEDSALPSDTSNDCIMSLVGGKTKRTYVAAGDGQQSQGNNKNLPSRTPALAKTAKVTSTPKNSGLKPSPDKALNRAGRRAPVPNAFLNGDIGVETKVPISVRSKVEFPKRLEDNVSSVPTVKPQLPEDTENVSFLSKSPIPVGALNRNRVGSRNLRRMSESIKTVDVDMADVESNSTTVAQLSKPSPPTVGERGVKRFRKSNLNDSCKETTTESEMVSLPNVSLRKFKDGHRNIENLSKSEILDIVIGSDLGRYDVHVTNNNIQNLYEDSSEKEAKSAVVTANECKGSAEDLLPTPESRTSGSSSSGSVETLTEQKRKLGPCRRVGLSRPRRSKVQPAIKEDANIAAPPSAEFVMPLSPESDVSASSVDQAKKMSVEPSKLHDGLDSNLRQGSAAETPASRGQRYSSEDLYKPRPLFNQQPRRTRGAASVLQSPEVAGPAAGVAVKRRAANMTSPDVTPLPKTKR